MSQDQHLDQLIAKNAQLIDDNARLIQQMLREYFVLRCEKDLMSIRAENAEWLMSQSMLGKEMQSLMAYSTFADDASLHEPLKKRQGTNP